MVLLHNFVNKDYDHDKNLSVKVDVEPRRFLVVFSTPPFFLLQIRQVDKIQSGSPFIFSHTYDLV